ncbi:response regulator transcription factor [Pseudactinotalea suaedae]|uniref:response regulator transcription factor n=1 Tax=Pseudactinotalea suaedae TaxID=1524924 RepID=UPI001F4FF810|nr:response regulator transcription factor [Pseudactinotalea suaedae]
MPADPTTTSVLVVDDEPMVREVVARYLALDGHHVHEAGDGAAARDLLAREHVDLVVLDVMLPELDGLTLLRQIRSQGDVPVVLLTARGEETDRLLGLELGADDYVVKPFSAREVVARVRNILRRATPSSTVPGDDQPAELCFGDLRIDTGARVVTVAGAEKALTAKEFDLLAFLATWPRQVFNRAQLLERVWDSSAEYQDPATVTVHVGRLRQKVEPDPEHPRWLTTVWGVGYRFDPTG